MPKWTPPQVLDPTKVKAIITTKWAGSAYKSQTIRRVESYTISSNLDSDADPWSLEIGNPDADLNPVLARDNEVRVQIFGAGTLVKDPLLMGITDDVTFTEQGTLMLSGRDMSCVATDSDHFPNIYRGMSPTTIIQTEARAIKCATKFQIKPIKGGPKRQQTDGSEKYWEFWYRMVRKEGMWIWVLPDGTLVVSDLNYNDPPVYHFVSKDVKDTTNTGIAVENVSWHKTTQGRLGKLGIEWRTQDVPGSKKPSVSVFQDSKTTDWYKRPTKLMQDKHAVSFQTAYKVAVEELFETRVGAVEIVLTVQDPGFVIRQNRMARVNIPEIGLEGDWFVVGSTVRGDSSGFSQDVRLREKKFAVSARVPDDPVWTKDPDASAGGGKEPSGRAASALYAQMGQHGSEWYDYFLSAAMKWHGLYDLALFMAVLLAIADHETSFRNIRSNNQNNSCVGGSGNVMSAPGEHEIEWYDIRKQSPSPSELDAWKQNFANEPGSYLQWCCAVGPMQLYSRGLKEEADGGQVDQFFGGRWNPARNIMVAAHTLNSYARTTNGSEKDLIAGVCHYGGFTSDTCSYGAEVQSAIHNSPGWLNLVEDALASAKEPTGSQLPGGVPEGTRGEIVRWAMNGYNTKRPRYGGFGGAYKNLAKGDWPAEADCSDFVCICYAWGTDFDEKADPNQNQWANGDTSTMALHGLEIPKETAQAGDVVLFLNLLTPGIGGDCEHACIFVENWRGEKTAVISHGGPSGAPPHKTDFGSEASYFNRSDTHCGRRRTVVKRYI